MPSPRPALALLPLLFLPAACGGESANDVIDRHRDAAAPRLERVHSLRQVVEKLQPLEADALAWDGFSIHVDGSSRSFGDNVRILYLPAFQPIETPLADPWDVAWTDAWWRLTAKSLREGARVLQDMTPKRIDGHFQELVSADYVVVIKALQSTPTKVIDEIGGMFQYEQPTFVGEAHVFELEGLRHLGGLRVPLVETEQAFVIAETREEFAESMDSRHRRHIEDRVLELIEKHCSGAAVPR